MGYTLPPAVKIAKCDWCTDPATHRLIEDHGGELLCSRHARCANINGLPTIEIGLRRKRVKVRRPVPPSEPPQQT